jgi:hypothetical protein
VVVRDVLYPMLERHSGLAFRQLTDIPVRRKSPSKAGHLDQNTKFLMKDIVSLLPAT